MKAFLVLRTNTRITPCQAVLRYPAILWRANIFPAATTLLWGHPYIHFFRGPFPRPVFRHFLCLVRQNYPKVLLAEAGTGPDCRWFWPVPDRWKRALFKFNAKDCLLPTVAPVWFAARSFKPPLLCRHALARLRRRLPFSLKSPAAAQGVVPHRPEFL